MFLWVAMYFLHWPLMSACTELRNWSMIFFGFEWNEAPSAAQRLFLRVCWNAVRPNIHFGSIYPSVSTQITPAISEDEQKAAGCSSKVQSTHSSTQESICAHCCYKDKVLCRHLQAAQAHCTPKDGLLAGGKRWWWWWCSLTGTGCVLLYWSRSQTPDTRSSGPQRWKETKTNKKKEPSAVETFLLPVFWNAVSSSL